MFKLIRKERGLTLKEVSAATGISFSFLGDIERGRTSPSIKTFLALVDYYRVPSIASFFCTNEPIDAERVE